MEKLAQKRNEKDLENRKLKKQSLKFWKNGSK